MQQQLETALAKLLEKAASGIDSASVFLQAQIPDVVHQFLMWRLWESIFNNVVGCVFIFISWRIFSSLKNRAPSKTPEDVIVLSYISLILSVILAAVFTNSAFAQILIAPKVYLIEQAAKIIKP